MACQSAGSDKPLLAAIEMATSQNLTFQGRQILATECLPDKSDRQIRQTDTRRALRLAANYYSAGDNSDGTDQFGRIGVVGFKTAPEHLPLPVFFQPVAVVEAA